MTNMAGQLALQPKQHTKALAHVDNDVGGSLRREHHFPGLPIEILDAIGENNAGNPAARRQRYFERVALHVTGNRAGDGEARFRVVGFWREDQGWTPAALLVTSLRIKGQPDQIS